MVAYERVFLFFKQYLSEKQNGYLESGVAYGRWSLTGGGRLREVIATRKLTLFLGQKESDPKNQSAPKKNYIYLYKIFLKYSDRK